MSSLGPTTLLSAWGATRDTLKAAGVESPVMDARLLLEAAAGVARLDILTDPYRALAPDALARLAGLTSRRAAREPLAYVLGRAPFWTFDLVVSPAVLTPRADTETLVRAALAALAPEEPARVLDLGTGSGAILLAILSERPLAEGVGVDLSGAALAVAQENAAALGLGARAQFLESDWGAAVEGPFDLVVSNPPYIVSAEIAGLAPEVGQYEPKLALDGGPDGMDAYRQLAPDLVRLLRPGGRFALEVGQGQPAALMEILRSHGLAIDAVRPDLAGIGRVVVGSAGV